MFMPGDQAKHTEETSYFIESIKAQKNEKGQILYLIRWRGYPDNNANNTWEPIENLVGSEHMVRAWEDERSAQPPAHAPAGLQPGLQKRKDAAIAAGIEGQALQNTAPVAKRVRKETSPVWHAFEKVDWVTHSQYTRWGHQPQGNRSLAICTLPDHNKALCLAVPATSAGVERMFSAAGRVFSDLRQAMKDTLLEAILFAKFNTE